MADDAQPAARKPEETKPEDREKRALEFREESIRLLQLAGQQARIAHDRAPRLGKKAQVTKSSFTYYAMAAEEASELKQILKATDLYKKAAMEAIRDGQHEDAAAYLTRAAEELRTDKLQRRRGEVPRLYAQASEESVLGQRVKDGIRYLEQAIQFSQALGEVTLAMEERVRVLKARIGMA